MPSRPSSHHSSENTPLLSRQDEDSREPSHYGEANGARSPAVESLRSLEGGGEQKNGRRWPTIIALSFLCVAVVFGCFGLAAPSIAQQYAKEALVFEPEKISIDSFTETGIRARVRGTFYLDASKVQKKPVRDIGRAATWIAKEVQTGESLLDVYLPEFGDVLLGSATVPPVKFNIRNKYYNHIDIKADLEPGDIDGIRTIAKQFMDGKLTDLNIKAVATVALKSGIFSLGKSTVTQFMHYQSHDIPKLPDLDIHDLQVAEYGPPGHPSGVKAMATVSMMNDYPIRFDVPPVTMEVLLPDCYNDYLTFGTTRTEVIHIKPKQMVNASVVGFVTQLPTALTTVCPESNNSPLDDFIGQYMSGRATTVYIRGGKQDPKTPEWIGKILQDITLPYSLPGHPFENVIKDFSMEKVYFSLPDPNKEGGKPEVSATVKVLMELPKGINVDVDIDRIRANGHVYYQGKELGKLDLSKWQPSKATKINGDLLITSVIDKAPLDISDEDVFAKVVQKLAFAHEGIDLEMRSVVDANTKTVLGEFTIRQIPAQGNIHITPPIDDGAFQMPNVTDMEVVDSTATDLILQARVNLTNPTDYSAHIPYMNVSIFVNDTLVGFGYTSLDIKPGPNDLTMRCAWHAGPVGAEWLSQFISGYNTSLTIRTHKDSMPGLPDIGMEMEVPVPHMFGTFMRETTMHILSSTATFLMVSPFAMLITSINAHAFHNGTPIGTIDYDYPFAIEAGDNVTPRLPVDWGLDGGLGIVRDALGGALKLDARADTGVQIGKWRERLWYEGKGITSKIRL